MLEKRKSRFMAVIKQQHRLPKSQRSQRVIDEAKAKVNTIGRWLKE